MKILADSQITNADIVATNVAASIFAEKLKTWNLTDNMRIGANNTVIDLDFGSDSAPVDMIGLCGTNLTSSAVIQLSYSDTDIESPDATITLSTFSEFNQIFMLDTALTRRYWRISITDTGNTMLWIGFLYIGKSIQRFAQFPHGSSREIISNSSVNQTGQEFGSKIYNAYSAEWLLVGMDYDDVEELIEIADSKQNIDRVLIVEYEESYDKKLYRPKYGILNLDSYPFAMSGNPEYYEVTINFTERF